MPSPAAPRFRPVALSFLRALRRHNDREWFRARREVYDTELKAPMIAVIERLAGDLRAFAPNLVASPKVSLYRIYRDTRFSPDKAPLKTNIAAIFPCRGLAKHEGAGLYLEVSPNRVLAAGGLYAPQPVQLHQIREHLARAFEQFRAIVESPVYRRTFGGLEGERLQRVPRGFPADHRAAEYLKFKQFLAWRE